MKNEKIGKILKIVKNAAVIIIAAAAVTMMIFTVLSVTMFDRNDRNIFGYKMFIVLSDSMAATDFGVDDIVVSRNVDPSTLVPGDIITYQSLNPDSFGQTITHKIRSLTTDANGEPGFITYGTTTGVDDETVVTYGFVIGKYCFSIPKLGGFFRYIKTAPGYIFCILLPFLLLIGIQAVSSVMAFRKYKTEQKEAIEAEEKAKLEAEREESQRLMREIEELKEKLAEKELQGGAGNGKEKTNGETSGGGDNTDGGSELP